MKSYPRRKHSLQPSSINCINGAKNFARNLDFNSTVLVAASLNGRGQLALPLLNTFPYLGSHALPHYEAIHLLQATTLLVKLLVRFVVLHHTTFPLYQVATPLMLVSATFRPRSSVAGLCLGEDHFPFSLLFTFLQRSIQS